MGIDRDHRQPARHRLDDHLPELLVHRRQHQHVGGMQGERQLVVPAPAGEEDVAGTLGSELAHHLERVGPLPLAGIAAEDHERGAPVEALGGDGVCADQQWNPLDLGEAADVEQHGSV